MLCCSHGDDEDEEKEDEIRQQELERVFLDALESSLSEYVGNYNLTRQQKSQIKREALEAHI